MQERDEIERSETEANITFKGRPVLAPDQVEIYREALQTLNDAGVEYAVGAAFARHAYTNIWRRTKDLDIFLQPAELKPAMDGLKQAGFETTIKEEHWLAKAWKGKYFIDLIFGTGHGLLPVDENTFRGSKRVRMLGVPVNLVPIEEMIASSAYIAGRNRFDGVEIMHLLRSSKGNVDWQRILNRLGEHRELLLWHLLLFNFVYPGHSDYLPKELMAELFDEIQQNWQDPKQPKTFRGTLLDPFSYNVDVENWGYQDPRIIEPLVNEAGEAL